MATAILLQPRTPPDYHRIASSKLTIPSDPEVSIPVGILACDPLLRSLDTTVVSATIVQPPAAAAEKSKKATKKAVAAPSLPTEPLLHVQLHDTVIFPEGGGQPTDIGTLTVKADGSSWEVLQAKRHGGHAVHYVRVKGDADAALKAFAPGTEVTVALGDEGYERRYDHMSMHTSQHLLSALLETRLDVPTLSWSLTTYPSPCYVEVPRGLTAEEVLSIQNEANRLVFEGRKVHVEVEELDNSAEPTQVQKTESGRAIGKALPEDYTGGVKRVVVIDGVDRNPCCGTHLPSIHNLQLFLLPHTEALSRSSTTNARLYFLAGPRLITYLTSTHNIAARTSAIMSCGPPLLPERVSQVVEERKKVEKRVNDLEAELAEQIAKTVLADQATKAGEGLVATHLHRVEDSTNALGFLSSVASAVSSKAEKYLSSRPYLFVLSSTPSTQTQNTSSVVLVIGSDDKIVKQIGDALKVKVGIKGGGKGPRWSGKYTGVWKATKENTAIADVLNEMQS
ncbi:hypothetical protein D9611_007716 [Ephemerocybe angulata]|uniref:ThrRS/AlaRS common domain-containing protein n=1 Tax=Ephemerocybe angulata TaxID=980116 RepID=A0A8H5FCL8_9AGAR|nr:hypothetical protein D9611_007716 [Tulosesus angulatus]